jgi:hypothetical protein
MNKWDFSLLKAESSNAGKWLWRFYFFSIAMVLFDLFFTMITGSGFLYNSFQLEEKSPIGAFFSFFTMFFIFWPAGYVGWKKNNSLTNENREKLKMSHGRALAFACFLLLFYLLWRVNSLLTGVIDFSPLLKKFEGSIGLIFIAVSYAVIAFLVLSLRDWVLKKHPIVSYLCLLAISSMIAWEFYKLTL